EQTRAGVVNRARNAARQRRKRRRQHAEGSDANRQIDVEDPAPRQMCREVAAEQRTGDAGKAEHSAKDSLVATAVTWWDDVAHDRLCRDNQPAAAESLHRAKEDQLRHVLSESAQRRADEKQDDG